MKFTRRVCHEIHGYTYVRIHTWTILDLLRGCYCRIDLAQSCWAMPLWDYQTPSGMQLWQRTFHVVGWLELNRSWPPAASCTHAVQGKMQHWYRLQLFYCPLDFWLQAQRKGCDQQKYEISTAMLPCIKKENIWNDYWGFPTGSNLAFIVLCHSWLL